MFHFHITDAMLSITGIPYSTTLTQPPLGIRCHHNDKLMVAENLGWNSRGLSQTAIHMNGFIELILGLLFGNDQYMTYCPA